MTTELNALVEQAQRGDLDAYTALVARFQDMAYGYAYSVLGDRHLAEDAAQEAFIAAYRSLSGLREPGAFAGWLRRIVLRRCQRLAGAQSERPAGIDTATDLPSPGPDPARVVVEREMKDRILQAIESLPAHERTVTALFYIDGYSQDEIADFLETPVTTVKSRLHRSRKRLKKRMLTMVDETFKSLALPDRFANVVAQMQTVMERINPLAERLCVLSDSALLGKTQELRRRLAEGEDRGAIRAEAFALVREAARRAQGTPHYDIQLVAALILDQGRIAQVASGEGKTLVCLPAAYMAVLEGRRVHIATPDAALAVRDAALARAALSRLGITVGQLPAAGDVGPDAATLRRDAYQCDLTYGAAVEFGFDYLRDMLGGDADEPVQGPLDFAIVDEADSVLIDEARTPLIISSSVSGRDETLATASIQAYFSRYAKLAGLTGTAVAHAPEFREVYGLEVAAAPTRRPANRVDHEDRVYATAQARDEAVVEEVRRYSREFRRPVLVGARSGAEAERLSAMLTDRGIPHNLLDDRPGAADRETQIMAGRRRQSNDGPDEPFGQVTIAARAAGRGADIRVDPNAIRPQCLTPSAGRLTELGVEADELFPPGAVKCCINCPEYDPETACVHCFKPKVDPAFPRAGLTGCSQNPPCGLHVVGMGRNDTRTADDQLRARAGRQGEPGSCRFFLNADDDLVQRALGRLGKPLPFEPGPEAYVEDKTVSQAILRVQDEEEQRRRRERLRLRREGGAPHRRQAASGN